MEYKDKIELASDIFVAALITILFTVITIDKFEYLLPVILYFLVLSHLRLRSIYKEFKNGK